MTLTKRHLAIAALTFLAILVFALDSSDDDYYYDDAYADEGYSQAPMPDGGYAPSNGYAQPNGQGEPNGYGQAGGQMMASAQQPPNGSGMQAGYGAGNAQPLGNGYVRHTGPEQAYTVEAPQGWQLRSSINRQGGGFPIVYAQFGSPDRQIGLSVPDGPPETYMEPNPQMGAYEGQQMGPVRISRFVPATEYVATYAQQYAQRLGCQQAQIVERRDRPDLVARSRQFLLPGITLTRFGTAEVVVHCQYNGMPTALIVTSSTMSLAPQNGMAMWSASSSTMITPRARLAEARQVLDHTQRTYTPNMQWQSREYQAMQQRIIAQNRQRRGGMNGGYASGGYTGGSTAGTGGYTGYTGGASDASHEAFINSIRGTQDLTDQFGDTHYGVETNSPYNWIDNSGNIVGTEIDENPNALEYTRMSSGGNDW